MTVASQRSLEHGIATMWLPLSLGAAIASATHVVLDFPADVYPTDVSGYLLVGVPAVILYALWMRALNRVANGSKSATKLAAIFALVQAALANGLIGLFPCPPSSLWGGDEPCELAPWQDLAHLGSLVFGAAAFIALRRKEAEPRDEDGMLSRIGLVVLAVHVPLAWTVAAMG